LELGADDFIRKPFGKRELLARVRAALRRRLRKNGKSSPSFTLLDLSIHPDELRASRGHLTIDLTPREIAILQLLHENTGRPVHRDTFLDRCWGLDYFPESRTLDQHIAQLRRKIEPDPAMPIIIETVRSVGYRYRNGA
jgi:two-component system alkaline phosphatase synthesis response regulator PhoP